MYKTLDEEISSSLKVTVPIVLLIFVGVFISYLVQEDNREDYRVQAGTVISVSNLHDTGTIILNATYYTVGVRLPDGRIAYGNIHSPVVEGQSVYRQCWTEIDSGIQYCNSGWTTYRPRL